MGRHWRYKFEILNDLEKNGLIEWSKNGNPRKIVYADEMLTKKAQDIWEYKDTHKPSYPTEKNINLLKRIVETSSDKDSIVLDPFAGSDTTLVSAKFLGRKFVGIDSSPEAIKVIKKKLTS